MLNEMIGCSALWEGEEKKKEKFALCGKALVISPSRAAAQKVKCDQLTNRRPTNQPTNEQTKWGEELHSLRPKTAIRLNFEGLFKRY